MLNRIAGTGSRAKYLMLMQGSWAKGWLKHWWGLGWSECSKLVNFWTTQLCLERIIMISSQWHFKILRLNGGLFHWQVAKSWNRRIDLSIFRCMAGRLTSTTLFVKHLSVFGGWWGKNRRCSTWRWCGSLDRDSTTLIKSKHLLFLLHFRLHSI